MMTHRPTTQTTRNTAVITGVGLVTPLGTTRDAVWRNIVRGKAASVRYYAFDIPDYPEMPAFPVTDSYTTRNEWQTYDPCIQFGLAAFDDACVDAGLMVHDLDPWRVGSVVSSSKGGTTTWLRYAERPVETWTAAEAEYWQANVPPDALSRAIARTYRLTGPTKNIVTACATGTHSIIEAVRMVEDGEVDVCFAGASDASINPLMIAGYRVLKAYGKTRMCPCDKDREGFIIGEGAGVVVVESEAHARARNAAIYGVVERVIAGQETANGIHYDSAGTALADCLTRLCAGMSCETIDYCNLHATGTQVGDRYETEQIKKAFGAQAYHLSCSATKSFTGHLLGAAGAVEVVLCLLSMKHQCVPPTVDYRTPDPVCDLDYTPNVARQKKIERALSISMGFGGQIGMILLRRGTV